ncbi:MFS transporter [Stackebrandtia nassauensis]|uniref:Major facilitator superfamily MFS_1 n=1 Tax=Stackebrandtia nassauensis (strain DSM 44728 / CIP 108903 / NRRL B-16338 / NBRC 102104 / LLR-40K-21) TaxID=446470 RepID=D3PW71_STANL|nr:MFS transporter [Stackebrandtia nassauensis]ADD41228.1 major facilitator superfamily MFS_1 [Stackebrandtia nassauensis DSM 44728]
MTTPRPAQARLALLACILASSLVGMDSLMTTVALSSIAETLDVGMSAQQWVLAAFLVTLGSLLLVGGALGDVYGRWRVFRWGTAAFGLAAAICALAPNAPTLIAGRMVQGAAAALLLPNVLAVLTSMFSGEARSKAIGSWSAWSGLSVIAGPPVGGLVISLVSWPGVYWLEVPLALSVLALIVKADPRTDDRGRGRVDLVGALLAVPAIGGVAFYLIQGASLGWSSPGALAALGAGIGCGVVFLWWERRTTDPLLPLTLFRIRDFTVINIVTFILYGGLISCGTYTVLFLQDFRGYPPAVAGLVSAIPIIVLFASSSRFGALADRYGARLFIGGGAIVAGLGILILLLVGSEADLYTVVIPSTLVHGIGLSMLVAPLTAGVMSSVDEERTGAASGVNNAVARIGSMLAIAVVGLLISAQFSTNVDEQLARLDPGPELKTAVAAAAEQPLAGSLPADATDAQRDAVEPLLRDASLDAFRTAVVVMGGLAVLAGAVTLVGMRRPPRRLSAEGTLGCPITGVRIHRDEPAISPLRRAPADLLPDAANPG